MHNCPLAVPGIPRRRSSERPGMWQLEGHTAACPGGTPKPGRLRRHGLLIRKTHPFPAPALCPARAAPGASGWREKTGVRGRMGGFLEEEGPSLSGRTAGFGYAVRRGRGRPGQGESGDGGEWALGRQGFRWGGRVGSHGRQGDRVSHGAHRALRGLWQGMGTVAPRRERAGGELLLKETHPLGSLLVQGPGNGPPYLTGSP